MRERYERRTYFSGGASSGYDDYYIQEISLRLTFRRFLKNLKKFVPQAENLLEVGCGYGFFLDEAGEFFTRRSGIELSAEAGAKARKTSGAHVHIGGAESLPPEMKEFFDKLFFTGIILLSLLERLCFANENYTLFHIYRIDLTLPST